MEYKNFVDKVVCITDRIIQKNKETDTYGTSHVLHTSEVHMIEAIALHRDSNANELASIMKITNGAVTQVAQKLIKKELIEPYRRDQNMKEVYYRLTAQGEIANKTHAAYHQEQYATMQAYVDSLSSEEQNVISAFLDALIDSWPSD
jgi:DNA-binding MarR family transcriptional regulator